MTSPTPIALRTDGRSAAAPQAAPGESAARADDRFIALASERRPRLSWIVPLERNGQQQTAFRLRLSLGTWDPRRDDAAFAFDTGEVEDRVPFVVLGIDLAADSLYLWTVRVRDEAGEWSRWADPASCETGPWHYDDWSADWIAHPALTVLRRRALLEQPTQWARLHVTAQGLVRASVNGVAVNADASDPSRTDLSRALYRSYDVTDLLAVGENAIEFALGLGEWERSGEDPRLLAELVARADDGTIMRAGTGAEMEAAGAQVTREDPFYLERHERIGEPAVFGASEALRVLEPEVNPASFATPPSSIAPDPSPPLHRVALHEVTELSRSASSRVYDVGVNIAGRTRLTVMSPVPAGTVVRVVHGEHLDAGGRLDTTNLTMPFDHGRVRQAVEYVIEGRVREVLEPWFAYHGFRYFEIFGVPAEADVTVEAWSVHSDLASVSELETDDPQVNALVRAARRTLLNNVHGIPEDCPTREQAGWTGDTASVTEFEFSAMDLQTFFSKWLADLRTSQQGDGSIPAISPDIRVDRISPDPVWGAALQRVLLGHWLHYGDERVVRETLPALRRWTDYQLTLRTADGVVGNAPISYGSDWLALEQTPPPLHHTAATVDSLESLATLEEAAGSPDAAAQRRVQADGLRKAERAAFYDEERDVFGNGTQAAHAVAVESGALTGAEAERAAGRIADDVRAHNDRLTSGFATTRTTIRALARAGHSQIVFDTLHQPAEPGIGAMLDHGPGTFWECWWIDPQNTGTGSLDHIGLGGPFAGWAWQWLAGVRPIAAGWSRFEVAPQFVDGVDSLSLRSRTVRGTVELRYRVSGPETVVELTVPVGSEAVLRLAGRDDDVLGPGWHERTVATALVRTTTRRTAHSVEQPWQPPFRPSPSPDVVGERDWLRRALADNNLRMDGNETVVVLPDGLRCMPVPHEQPHGPVALVRGGERATAEAGATVSVRVPVVASGLDRSDATFVYAILDLCLENPQRPLEMFLVVRGADGSRTEGAGTIWPAGWNRVSADISALATRTAIESVEVGVRVRLDSSAAAHDDVPLAFHLGEVGCSTVRRTW
ncbi:family 78 glycoside hydrolase catalytic domain [Kribbella sp. CA-245084]|uniref:family 78 glycoside hydrolase catalytic domain n=1 Tax=Kribbella sp. CA-245084 TaxID=3239940 RepID=UPI003D8E9D34